MASFPPQVTKQDLERFWEHPDFAVSFEHARQVTAHFAKSFYISAQLFPREQRWATYAVYGFCRYADNIVDVPRERSNDELFGEIEALRRELDLCYRTGESEHPVMRPFALVARRYGVPIAYAQDLLLGVVMDANEQYRRYESFDDLYVFCYRVASVVGLMMTSVLGYADDTALLYAEKMGIAMQLTNILRDVQEDAKLGRIYLPSEDLRRFEVSEDDIIHERFTPNVRALMQFQVERAHRYYDEATPGIRLLPRQSQFAIYAASRIYRGILDKIAARDFNPFLGRVFVPQSKKIHILLAEIVRTRVLRRD
jgi:15-cis-phytoene synthase